MKIMRRASRWLAVLVLVFVAFVGAPALAGPRSGGSFSGRQGFRSGGGITAPGYSGGGYNYSSPGYYGGGSHFLFFPSWGLGGFGGFGGFGLISPLLAVVVIGLIVGSVMRAVRASRNAGGGPAGWGDEGEAMAAAGRAYLYKLQLALGRSARGIQDRLGDFAASGDTATEAGLAALLQQTALELLRERDSVRYASAEARGPLSYTNAETSMNGLALAERGRFQVERVRGTDGRVVRSSAAAEEGKEALELVVVTVLAATRAPLDRFIALTSPEDLAALLSELGGVSPDAILGLEVIWTPADPDDSMTETDVMTTYPELRSL